MLPLGSRLLRQYGDDPAQAFVRRQHNEVWVGQRVVAKIGRARWVHREVVLAPLLPPAVGYPELIAAGVEGSAEWMVLRKLPGVSLAEAWPDLSPAARRRGSAGLITRHLAIASTSVPLAASLNLPMPDFYAPTIAEAHAQLASLVATGALDEEIAQRCLPVLETGYAAMAHAPTRVVHGDASPVHGYWDRDGIVGLIDFENASLAPWDLDLDKLLHHFSQSMPEGLGPLVTVAQPLLEYPGARSRLRLYAVLMKLCSFLRTMDRGVSASTIRTWAYDTVPPWSKHTLNALLTGTSYLDELEIA